MFDFFDFQYLGIPRLVDDGGSIDTMRDVDIIDILLFGDPVIVVAITSLDVSLSATTIEQSIIGQIHALASQDVVSGVPVIEQSSIGQKHSLLSSDILSGTIIIEQSSIGQIHGLTLADLLFGTPTLENATIKQVHALLSQDLLSGTLTIDQATATGFVLIAVSLGLLPTRSLSGTLSARNTDISPDTRTHSATLGIRNRELL